MADVKISALTDAAAVADADELVIVQGGVTKRVTVAELLAGVGGGGSSGLWTPITTAVPFTNMGAADTLQNYMTAADWTDATEYRIQMATDSAAGSSGSVIRVKYNPTPLSFTAGDFAALTGGDLSLVSTFTFVDTGWLSIDAAARTTVALRIGTQGGDGATDPRVNFYALQWR